MAVEPATSADLILDLVEAGRRDAVVDAIVDLAMSEGTGAVLALLTDVQREVGLRWHRNQWTVADEHAATAMVDLALGVVCGRSGNGTVGSVVVACAEEEWHVFPPRMLGEQMRLLGWEVRFLGGSVPADHLRDYAAAHRPDAVLVSCSTPLFLPGARRSVVAAHATGAPVLIGGAALGTDPLRSVALGADGWAVTAEAADRIARDWLRHPPPLARSADDADQLALSADRPLIVTAALRAISTEFPTFAADWTSGGMDARGDLDGVIRVIESAIVTRDDRIVAEHVQWLVPYLEQHGVPREATAVAFQALARELGGRHRARSMLDIATAALRRMPR